MNDSKPKEIELTDFGWAVKSDSPPDRLDMFWLKIPERHVYYFDDDRWIRLHPPEHDWYPENDLPHG